MLKEIRAIAINLNLNDFKEILEASAIDNSMPIIEITKEVKEKITKRNKTIKIIFEDITYTVIPNKVGIDKNKYFLELAAYSRGEL